MPEKKYQDTPWPEYFEGVKPPQPRKDAPPPPDFNPTYWEDRDLACNANCYTYAAGADRQEIWSDSATPGYAGGACVNNGVCLPRALISDDLIPAPYVNPPDVPGYYLVACFMSWRGWHFFRKDANGAWSHKPGYGNVTNLDWSGNPILDPLTANRDDYDVFVGFFYVRNEGASVGCSLPRNPHFAAEKARKELSLLVQDEFNAAAERIKKSGQDPNGRLRRLNEMKTGVLGKIHFFTFTTEQPEEAHRAVAWFQKRVRTLAPPPPGATLPLMAMEVS